MSTVFKSVDTFHTEEHSEATGLKVVNVGRYGKRRYDRQTKQKLVEACLEPGASVAGLALKHGVNANLLRKWIKAASAATGWHVPTASADWRSFRSGSRSR
jgi:transposase-like protein